MAYNIYIVIGTQKSRDLFFMDVSIIDVYLFSNVIKKIDQGTMRVVTNHFTTYIRNKQ